MGLSNLQVAQNLGRKINETLLSQSSPIDNADIYVQDCQQIIKTSNEALDIFSHLQIKQNENWDEDL